MKGTVDYKWETVIDESVSTLADDADSCFSQSAKVKIIIQPKTKCKTLSSKVFIRTPLARWQSQLSAYPVQSLQLFLHFYVPQFNHKSIHNINTFMASDPLPIWCMVSICKQCYWHPINQCLFVCDESQCGASDAARVSLVCKNGKFSLK